MPFPIPATRLGPVWFVQSLSLSSIIIAAKTPPEAPAFFFLAVPILPYDFALGREAVEVSQALLLFPPVPFFALLVFLLDALLACFPDARLFLTRKSNEASSSNHPRLSFSSWDISSRISSFRARALVSFTDSNLPLALSSSFVRGIIWTLNSTISFWYFRGEGAFGDILASMAFRFSTFAFVAVSFSTFFGFFSAFAVSKSRSMYSKRSVTCSSSCFCSSAVMCPSTSTCFCIASFTILCFSARSSTETVSYRACSLSSRTTPSMSRSSRFETSLWMSAIAALQPFFWLHDRHRFLTMLENIATVDRAIISSGLPSRSSTELPPRLAGSPPPCASSTASRIIGKTTTVFRFFPVSCWSLNNPAHSRTQDAARSSSKPSVRSEDVTALAQPSSYFCRPSFPAPVTKVIRIMSSMGKGSLKACVMLVVTVAGVCPARSKVSLSVEPRIEAASPDAMAVVAVCCLRSNPQTGDRL
mmetsp:Transcript_25936/g.55520  ORF Transcript_25936/g.55520 Transcript_25936/m.55520 type:complete len:473 (-) Transcript_25936:55-1473(-)